MGNALLQGTGVEAGDPSPKMSDSLGLRIPDYLGSRKHKPDSPGWRPKAIFSWSAQYILSSLPCY